jgi:hypothetical protein
MRREKKARFNYEPRLKSAKKEDGGDNTETLKKKSDSSY